MEVMENELQALRKELDTFRDENIALYNELTNQNKTLYKEIVALREENFSLCKELAQNQAILLKTINRVGGEEMYDLLGKHLNRLAAIQTAELVTRNMLAAKIFNDRFDHLKYVASYNQSVVGGGGYLEFGVAAGRSINIISSLDPDKVIYGFDSFEGLPEDWTIGNPRGRYTQHGKLPPVNKNVRLIKGLFNETLPEFVKAHPEPCAFIHVDCDLYSSTKTIFAELKNQIVSGTVIAFDEYFNYPGWQEGEYKAFMEFVAENNLEFEYISRTNRGQVAVKIL